jgi:uncharacterized protein (TIGR03435 family)
MNSRTITLSAIAGVASMFGQSDALTFEVASIKKAPIERALTKQDDVAVEPNSLAMRNTSLRECVRWAYNIKDPELTAPDWMMNERFDIVARTDAPASEDQLRRMLQSLLKQRFDLRLHNEQRQVQVLALVRGSGPVKFTLSVGEGIKSIRPGRGGRSSLEAKWVTMAQLAELLSIPLRQTVLDMTSLAGQYDFLLDLSRDVPPPQTEPSDGLAAAVNNGAAAAIAFCVKDQLGLRLEARRIPIEVTIVDNARRDPIEN